MQCMITTRNRGNRDKDSISQGDTLQENPFTSISATDGQL